MQFTIEQLQLTDDAGIPIGFSRPREFHAGNSDSAAGLLVNFVRADGAKILGTVTEFHGHQAMVTAKKGERVYTLHAYPTENFRAC
ncbi:MAG TPA: hypothetical protein VKH35_05670 [Thermoanaerobaculia bacterium]|nr:hypothetical protein [Thermoanaerobaculia bacterium]